MKWIKTRSTHYCALNLLLLSLSRKLVGVLEQSEPRTLALPSFAHLFREPREAFPGDHSFGVGHDSQHPTIECADSSDTFGTTVGVLGIGSGNSAVTVNISERNEVVFVEPGEGTSDEGWTAFTVSDSYRNDGVAMSLKKMLDLAASGETLTLTTRPSNRSERLALKMGQCSAPGIISFN